MEYITRQNKIIITSFKSFDISETLECGQCFRFKKIKDDKYIIVAHNKLLTVEQCEGKIIMYPCTEYEFKNIWINYFDLNRNYTAIKELLSSDDVVLKDAVEFAPGIRILSQDIFECLISFIISQNNRIPMIKKVIQNICMKFGSYLDTIDKEQYFSFPTIEQLLQADINQLLECKTGFRAKYIIDAVSKVYNNTVEINNFDNMSTTEIKRQLMLINGVGDKVSDCVILFSCGRFEVFPTDVWVKRVMQHFYFNNAETSIDDIHKLAQSKFNSYAGFAQQYLFHYARQFNIGGKKGKNN